MSYFVEFKAGRGTHFPVRRSSAGLRHGLTPEQAREMAKKTLGRVLSGLIGGGAARLRAKT